MKLSQWTSIAPTRRWRTVVIVPHDFAEFVSAPSTTTEFPSLSLRLVSILFEHHVESENAVASESNPSTLSSGGPSVLSPRSSILRREERLHTFLHSIDI